MKHPATSFVLALVSVILVPILLFIEFTALFFAAMVTYEPNNPMWVKIVSVIVVILIGLLTLSIPVSAVLMGARARATARSTHAQGTGLATAAVVIAGIVTAVALVTQVFVIFSSFG